MQKIAEICDEIAEELNDADKYVTKALELKECDKTSAEMYYQLSVEEMTHSDRLHKRVVELINEYRKVNGDPPPEMQWRYDYLHKNHIKKATEIKVKQMLYKE